MSSINTVSGNGNKNYVSGLASGMDTESIVKSLLMGTQTKIDKQSGLKQQLEWKQEQQNEEQENQIQEQLWIESRDMGNEGR